MKRIIDIPNELAEKGHRYTDEELWAVVRAVQNGIPLDKIRDKIEQLPITDTAIRLVTEIIESEN